MAKMFYTAAEACEKLGKSEDDLRQMVREGALREFRDAGSINFKVDDVDKLSAQSEHTDMTSASASASGEIILEPVEDSGIELAASGSDVLSLEEVDPSEATATGTSTGSSLTGSATSRRAKEDSVVASVGVNVFDDDDLDEDVDPLAQTAVTDVAGLGIDGPGSGSGIMDLTRESDDTSLGAELLDEIYSDEDAAAIEMGEATRAGLEEAIEEPEVAAEEVFSAASEPDPAVQPVRAASTTLVQTVEYAPDAVSTSLSALMVVAIAVMWVAGLGGASMVRGISPRIITAIYDNLIIFAGGAAGVAAIAAGVTFVLLKGRK